MGFAKFFGLLQPVAMAVDDAWWRNRLDFDFLRDGLIAAQSCLALPSTSPPLDSVADSESVKNEH